jgi:hypothetical protein
VDETLRCRRCGDVIGVYEPMILLEDGKARETSRAAEPDVDGRGDRFHGYCYEQLVQAHGADEAVM